MATASPNILAARVTGRQPESPQHPRVAPPTVENLLGDKPPTLRCFAADATLRNALQQMPDGQFSALLVTGDGHPAGVFSEYELARPSLLLETASMDMPLSKVMTPCTAFVSPEDSVERCLNLMHERQLHYLPVLSSGKAIALLSPNELLEAMLAHYQRVFKAIELDQQILFLRGTYSC